MKRSISTPFKSPEARRRLYASSPKSPNQEKCYAGYVVHVGQLCKAATGNDYFDMKFKYGEHDILSVRVMQYENELDLFKFKKGVPISINVKISGNTIFFNKRYNSKIDDILYQLDFNNEFYVTPLDTDLSKISSLIVVEGTVKWMGDKQETSTGHQVRDGVLKDKHGNIKISLWNSLCNLEEKKWYVLTDIEIKQYFGTVLATTRTTGVEEKQLFNAEDWDIEFTDDELLKYSQEEDTCICCAEIISADMKMYLVHCTEVIQTTGNAKVAKCPDCLHTINLKKCERKFKGSLEVEKDKIYNLSFDLPLISKLFMDPKILSLTSFDQVEEKVVLLENFDIYHNRKMAITKIVSHEHKLLDDQNKKDD